MERGKGLEILGAVTVAIGLAGCVARTVPVTNERELVLSCEECGYDLYYGEQSDAEKLKVSATYEFPEGRIVDISLIRHETPGTNICTRITLDLYDSSQTPQPYSVTDMGCVQRVDYIESGNQRTYRVDFEVDVDSVIPMAQAAFEEDQNYSQRLRAWHERKGVE